jgi:hypothetical protein
MKKLKKISFVCFSFGRAGVLSVSPILSPLTSNDFGWEIYKSMKHLQSFSLFEAQFPGLTPDQEAFLNEYTNGTWSVNRQTGLVDVEGSFNCKSRRLKSLSDISFGHVSGHFLCANNQLTTLVGAPQTVDGGFYCYNNQLTTLAGAPQTVGGRFSCDSFKLQNGKWNPQGWLEILATGDSKARSLIVTLPMFDAGFWLQKLKGDLKKDGQVLLQLASLWDEPGWKEQRQEIEQGLSPEQLRVIKALKTKLGYVDPWKDGIV